MDLINVTFRVLKSVCQHVTTVETKNGNYIKNHKYIVSNVNMHCFNVSDVLCLRMLFVSNGLYFNCCTMLLHYYICYPCRQLLVIPK